MKNLSTRAFLFGLLALLVAQGASAQLVSSMNGGATPESLLPGTLYTQNTACGGGPASQSFPDFGNAVLQSADDFVVPTGLEWTIDRVTSHGSFSTAGPLTNVIVQVWDDAAGQPGTMLCEDTGANEEAPGPGLALTLTNCAGPWVEGAYWVSMMADMAFGTNGQWFQNSNASTNGAEFHFQDPDSLLGPGPCTAWGPGVTTCGINTLGNLDLCFSFDGTEVAAGQPIIEVPTVSTIGLAALLLLLGGGSLFVLRRRRQTS